MCPRYDTKQYDGVDLLLLELWGMQGTLLLSSLPGPLWPEAPDRVLSMGQTEHKFTVNLCQNEFFEIELFEHFNWLRMLKLFWDLNCVFMLNWIVWNRTVYKYKSWFGIK